MIGNHNNELNARFHRNAVAENIHALKVVCDEMNDLLVLSEWDEKVESYYDELSSRRGVIINKLKLCGMYL